MTSLARLADAQDFRGVTYQSGGLGVVGSNPAAPTRIAIG
jgi:hypothetical protein